MSTTTVIASGSARQVAKTRALKSFRPLLVLVLVVGLMYLLSVMIPKGDDAEFGINNPRPDGARALAQVLGHNGVSVSYTESLPQALATAKPNTTVMIRAFRSELTADDTRALIKSGANLVFLAPGAEALETLDLGVRGSSAAPTNDPVPAACELAPAVAATEIISMGTGYEPTADSNLGDLPSDADASSNTGITDAGAILCFEDSSGFSGVTRWHVVAKTLTPEASADPQTITVVSDHFGWSNARILEAGNAALALNLLGQNETLTWFVPQIPGPTVVEGGSAPLPPRFLLGVGVLGLATVFLIIAASRRLGPVVTERLPVVVQGSETTLGRGRLYRSGRATGRAGAALRAATASRLAKRLGLTRAAEANVLVSAIAAASTLPEPEVDRLLYGPRPTTDQQLVDLANALSDLESEIAK